MDEVLKLFRPDNVFTLVFFLSFLGTGVFLSRNWQSILDFLKKREENRHEEMMSSRDSNEMTREALSRLTHSMEDNAQKISKHTLEIQKLVLKVDVMIQVLERVAERMGNGHTKNISG